MDKHAAWFSAGNYRLALLPTPQYTTNPDWISTMYKHLEASKQLKPVPQTAASRRPLTSQVQLASQEREMYKRRALPRQTSKADQTAALSRPNSARSSRPGTAQSWISDNDAVMFGGNAGAHKRAPPQLPPMPRAAFASASDFGSPRDENRAPEELSQFARTVDYSKYANSRVVSLALRKIRDRVNELDQERGPLQPMVLSAR